MQPSGFIHLKTDSPDLYEFTRLAIKLYRCTVAVDEDDVYKNTRLDPELRIKTYYESLDIAESSRIHYLKFSLPEQLPGKEADEQLKEILKANEGAG
jgi:tRNA (guanine-N7-)-methyltransferase